jgi:hypothetical protein
VGALYLIISGAAFGLLPWFARTAYDHGADPLGMLVARFILAALGEELGLAGIFAILSLFLLLIYRGLRIANSHPDDFSRLLSTGL